MAIIESNTLIEIQKRNGDVERHYPITKLENVIGIEKLSKQQMKALQLLAVNSYIVDDVTGKTYVIGASDGNLYFEESDVSVKELLDTIVEATTD